MAVPSIHIFYGPQACGKSYAARQLAMQFQATHGWHWMYYCLDLPRPDTLSPVVVLELNEDLLNEQEDLLTSSVVRPLITHGGVRRLIIVLPLPCVKPSYASRPASSYASRLATYSLVVNAHVLKTITPSADGTVVQALAAISKVLNRAGTLEARASIASSGTGPCA